MKYLMVRLELLLPVVISLGGVAVGQEEAKPEGPRDAQPFREAARQYTLTTAEQPDEHFELLSKPLLTWSNPERGTASGAVFLYTHRGRPQAALCIYPNGDRLDHEFQSLAGEPLVGYRDGSLVWAPLNAGMEMKPIDEASPPGGTPFLRLRQMRNLSRRFEAEIVNPKFSPKPLRLLSTPLYRYPADELPQGVIDGALFSFVQSTDPEVLLVIEAREDAAGTPQWHAGLARMSMVLLRVRLDGEAIWTTNWANQNPTATYYTLSGER